MDANSKITLTGNYYYTDLNNDDSNGNNIIKGNFTFSKYNNNVIQLIYQSFGNYFQYSMLLLFILFLEN